MKFEINKRFLYYRMTPFLWLHTFMYEIVDPISNMNRNHHFYVMCLSTWVPSEAIIYCPSICHHHLREVWRVWIIYILVSDKWYLRSWLREVWMRKGHFQGFPELSIYERIRFMWVFQRQNNGSMCTETVCTNLKRQLGDFNKLKMKMKFIYMLTNILSVWSADNEGGNCESEWCWNDKLGQHCLHRQ